MFDTLRVAFGVALSDDRAEIAIDAEIPPGKGLLGGIFLALLFCVH